MNITAALLVCIGLLSLTGAVSDVAKAIEKHAQGCAAHGITAATQLKENI